MTKQDQGDRISVLLRGGIYGGAEVIIDPKDTAIAVTTIPYWALIDGVVRLVEIIVSAYPDTVDALGRSADGEQRSEMYYRRNPAVPREDGRIVFQHDPLSVLSGMVDCG